MIKKSLKNRTNKSDDLPLSSATENRFLTAISTIIFTYNLTPPCDRLSRLQLESSNWPLPYEFFFFILCDSGIINIEKRWVVGGLLLKVILWREKNAHQNRYNFSFILFELNVGIKYLFQSKIEQFN